ncbi:SOS response-associated peptidase [Chitinimonas arctica]|uniref:Abasic site processing protein n=1 Tax=Chitinimonas arctica TaxID=2594795 RepID=A0A516SJE7_9NEIS|nr:SOS response-associated peptidase family protein [Chitinimonas arctica]QDQ28266.1 SOS response-associated peptidase [Chitinimonas arctica]
MCGRYNVIDNPNVRELCATLGIKLYPDTRKNIAPGGQGQFVVQRDGERQLLDGIWSALIQPKPEGSGYRPHPDFKTFNARSDRLGTSKLWRRLYTSQRAIIPTSGWHEWVGKQCYELKPLDGALAFGGLYQVYAFGEELVPAYTIITCPPHAGLSHIHDKSLPLILQLADFDAWLDPTWKHPEIFQSLMLPKLHAGLQITPVDSPKALVPVGPMEVVEAD